MASLISQSIFGAVHGSPVAISESLCLNGSSTNPFFSSAIKVKESLDFIQVIRYLFDLTI